MALTWDYIVGKDVSEIYSEDVTDLYNGLIEFAVDNEEDVSKLKKLFEVTQTVLIHKGSEIEEIIEHMKESAKKDGRKAAQKNREIEDLKLEIQSLKKQNKDREQAGRFSGADWKNKDIEQQLLAQQGDLRDALNKLAEERENSDQLKSVVEDYEQKIEELKIDNEQLRTDLHAVQQQLDSQKENIFTRFDNDDQLKEKINNKNALLNSALDENKKLAEYNSNMEKEIEELKKELMDGKKEIELSTEQYKTLKESLDKDSSEVETLAKENSVLKLQIEDLIEKLRLKSRMDDEVLAQVNGKVIEWKKLLDEKNGKIEQLEELNSKLKSEIFAKNLPEDDAALIQLQKMLEEKENQLESLTLELKDCRKELEENAIFMEDVMQKMGKKNDNETTLNKDVTSLKHNLRLKEEELKEMVQRCHQTEDEMTHKEKKLGEALTKMANYEQGIYGLPEAVNEIKQLEGQCGEKEKMIHSLTQYANNCELKINELCDEVEDLRDRLGLEPQQPFSIEDSVYRKGLRVQKDKSLNKVLQQEIERLEDERLDLKNQVRIMTQSLGQRALLMGLSVEDVEKVEEYMEELKSGTNKRKLQGPLLEDGDVAGTKVRMNVLYEENTDLKVRLKEIETENKAFEKVILEFKSSSSNIPKNLAESGSIGKLIEILESRHMVGRYDKSLMWKGQADKLVGCNDELRKMLTEKKLEEKHSQVEMNKIIAKNMALESELEAFRKSQEAHKESLEKLKSLSRFPSDINSHNLQSLSEQLFVSLQEGAVEKQKNDGLTVQLNELQDKLEAVLQQQSVSSEELDTVKKISYVEKTKLQAALEDLEEKNALYKIKEKYLESYFETIVGKGWQKEFQKHNNLSENNDENIEYNVIKINERTFEGSKKDDELNDEERQELFEGDVMKVKLGDLTRKIIMVSCNEEVLVRKVKLMQLSNDSLFEENENLKNELLEREKTVMERINYLQAAKEGLSLKVSSLQQKLLNTVSINELDSLNKQYTLLMEKHRGILENEKNNSLLNQQYKPYIEELESVRSQLECMRGCVHEEKFKRSSLEVALGCFQHFEKNYLDQLNADSYVQKLQELIGGQEIVGNANGSNTSGNSNSGGLQVEEFAQKIALLEMKELNEREKASYAEGMMKKIKEQNEEADKRLHEFSTKFDELAKINLEMQAEMRTLRDELSNSVPSSVNESDKSKLNLLQEQVSELSIENSKLKQIADIAVLQVQTLSQRQTCHETEVQLLKRQLADLQASSDENTIIARLHIELLKWRIGEQMASKKLEMSYKKVEGLECRVLELEKVADEKEDQKMQMGVEYGYKLKHLKNIIKDQRRRYAGSIPLYEQEHFNEALIRLNRDKLLIEEHLVKALEARNQAEEEKMKLDSMGECMSEMVKALESKKTAEMLSDWNNKMHELRLKNAQINLEKEKLSEKITYLDNLLHKSYKERQVVEEEKINIMQEYERNEMEWEKTEVILECKATRLQNQIDNLRESISHCTMVDALPSEDLPLPERMEKAVAMINKYETTLRNCALKEENLKKKLEMMEREMEGKEEDLLKRERVIAFLRLKIPDIRDYNNNNNNDTKKQSVNVLSAEEIDRIVADALNSNQNVNENNSNDYVAKTTIDDLKSRLNQKEQSIKSYNELLEKLKEQMRTQQFQHDQDLSRLQRQLEEQREVASGKIRKELLRTGSDEDSAIKKRIQSQSEKIHNLNEELRSKDGMIFQYKQQLQNVVQLERDKLVSDKKIIELDMRIKNKDLMMMEMQQEIDRLKTNIFDSEQNEIQLSMMNTKEKNKIEELEVKNKILEAQVQDLMLQQKTHLSQQQQLLVKLEKQPSIPVSQKSVISKGKETQTKGVNPMSKFTAETYKKQLAIKDQKIQSLNKAIADMREEMVFRAQNEAKTEIEEAIKQVSAAKLAEDITKDYKGTIENLDERLKKQLSDNKHLKSRIQVLESDLKMLNLDLEAKENVMRKVTKEKELLKHEALQCKSKADTYNLIIKEKTKEIESLKRTLEEVNKLNRCLIEDGGRYDRVIENKSISQGSSMTRNEKKASDRDLKNLQEELMKKNSQIKQLQDSIAYMKSTMKSKETSDNEFPTKTSKSFPENSTAIKLKNKSIKTTDEVAEDSLLLKNLKYRVDQLQKENSSLRSNIEETKNQNALLVQLVEDKEKIFKKERLMTPNDNCYKEFLKKEDTYKKEIINLTEKNLSLNLDMEKAHRELPRLKEKIDEQRAYIDLLRSEQQHMVAMNKSRESLSTVSGSSVKKIGESGRSPEELERTIAILKKVIDKTKKENELLKKNIETK